MTYAATRHSNGTYTLSDPHAPRFKEFLGAIGWLSLSVEGNAGKHALLAAGIQEDGRFNVLLERFGGLAVIAEEAVNIKDRLLIKRIWLDNEPICHMQELWNHDGLTRYFHDGEDREGNTLWRHPDEHWPNFRGREQENRVALVGVPPEVKADLLAGADRIERLTRNKKLLIHSSCTELRWCFSQPLKDVMKHPAWNALIWLTWAMETACGPFTGKTTTPTNQRPIYGNLPR